MIIKNKEKISTMIILFAISFCMTWSTPAQAKKCVEKQLDSATEVVSQVQENWNDDYFEEMTVHEDSNQVDIDGDKDTFTDTFDVNAGTMKKAVSSGDNLEEFLEGQQDETGNVYEVEEKEDGTYTVTAPYQMKHVVVYSTNLSDDYGAIEKYVYEEGGETILCFSTDKDTEEAYRNIKEDLGEKSCYVDTFFSVEDTAQAYSWGGKKMGMSSLKSTATSQSCYSNSVTVAVVDTGIVRKNSVFSGRKILSSSYNFYSGNKKLTDTNGHGTHVAGIIADSTPNNVNFLILKVAGESGNSSSLIMEQALNYAVSQNVDVINMSFGFVAKDASQMIFLDDVINRAYKKGIPICVAAGNTTKEVKGNSVNYCYPACNKQAVTVSALDKDMKIASYSYRGSAIDFAAPGTKIVSAGIRSSKSYKETMSGTSMATPHITAAMAYIKMMNKNLSVQGVCLELKKYCVDLGESGKDVKYGYGCPIIGKLWNNGTSYDSWTVSNMVSTPHIISCSNAVKGTKVCWNKVSGAKGYYIYRAVNVGTFKKIATVSSGRSSYVDRKTKEGSFTEYYVVAYSIKNGTINTSGKSDTLINYTMKRLSISKVRSSMRKISFRRSKNKFWRGKVIQVQYSTSKTFDTTKTKTIKSMESNLSVNVKKKGVYYFRVRTKFSLMGNRFYSAWSAVKKIKVK